MILCCKIISQEGAKAPYLIQAWAFTYFCSLESEGETTENSLQLFTPSPRQFTEPFKKAINICAGE